MPQSAARPTGQRRRRWRGRDDPLRARVDVDPAIAREAREGEVAVVGEADREARGGRADADEDRRARDRRLLDELEGEPAATRRDGCGCSGSMPSSSAYPITLSSALWRPTSSRTDEQLAVRREQAARVQPAGARERRLPQAVGQAASSVARDARPGATGGRVHGDLLQRALAADAARGGRVEAARARLAGQRPVDLDRVRLERGRPAGARAVDQPLAVEEAERELLVLARRPHRDGDRARVHSDLQRLLDRDLVLEARGAYGRVRPTEFHVRHRVGLLHARRPCRPAGRRLRPLPRRLTSTCALADLDTLRH